MIPPQLTVQCHRKKIAPREMIRGSATTDHQFAYFTSYSSDLVYSYEWNTEQWNKLPSSPHRYCALVIIDGTLTTVGGISRSDRTNKLFTLRQRQWVEEYPPMNTARSSPAVVSTSGGDYIIVIGGYCGGGGWTGTVELSQVKTRRWYKLTNTPQPLTFPSATICGTQLHVIGHVNSYSCSILSSDEPITSQSIPHLISWTSLPRLPVTQSTAATLYGQLVIIGGRQYGSSVNSIHQLVDRGWLWIGSMSSDRSDCLVVSPSPDRMIIVGGGYEAEDSIEECNIVV